MSFSVKTRSRSWICTIHITNMEKAGLTEKQYKNPEYLADYFIKLWEQSGKSRTAGISVCVSKDGCYHAHMACYGNITTLKRVSEILYNAHVEPQLAGKEKLSAYLLKEGEYAEKGEQVLYFKGIEKIQDVQGSRNDITEIAQMIDDGCTPKEIYAEYFGYRRYDKMIKSAYLDKRVQDVGLLKEMHNEYHFGESGTGKSYTYIKLCEKYGEDNIYLVNDYYNGGVGAFDMYSSNPCDIILMDEFRGDMSYSTLLGILDKYSRNQLHCRFQNVYCLWTSVYICSVLPPEEVYSRMVGENDRRSDPFSQLLRRLDKIVYHYIENGEYKIYEKPASEYHSAYQMQCEAQKVTPLYPALYTGNMDDFNALTSYSKISAAAPVPVVATPPTPQTPTTSIPQSSPTSIEAKAGAPTPPETAGETSAPTLSQTE